MPILPAYDIMKTPGTVDDSGKPRWTLARTLIAGSVWLLTSLVGGFKTHIGRVNRHGVTEAEIYVISNRDVKSVHAS